MAIFIVIVIVFIILGMISSSVAQGREQEIAELKEKMKTDSFIQLSKLNILETVIDLKNAPVRVLRTGGHFYILFSGGSVYYETRWVEGKGENRQVKKNTQCLLDRLSEGKNPLSDIEDAAFAEIVKEALDKVSWMSVTVNGREIKVSKAQGIDIPEAE